MSPYLWNLLPENPIILQRWGQQFHVSPASPFKLLRFVWQALASACAVNPEILIDRLRHLADALPEAIAAARDQTLTDGLNRRVITTLAALLIQHAKDRRATLDAASSKRNRARKIAI